MGETVPVFRMGGKGAFSMAVGAQGEGLSGNSQRHFHYATMHKCENF